MTRSSSRNVLAIQGLDQLLTNIANALIRLAEAGVNP